MNRARIPTATRFVAFPRILYKDFFCSEYNRFFILSVTCSLIDNVTPSGASEKKVTRYPNNLSFCDSIFIYMFLIRVNLYSL